MTYKPNLSRSARLSAGSRPSLPGQDPKREEELRIELTQELQPQGRFEQMWIEDIAYRTAMIEVTRAQIAGCRTRMVRGLLDNLRQRAEEHEDGLKRNDMEDFGICMRPDLSPAEREALQRWDGYGSVPTELTNWLDDPQYAWLLGNLEPVQMQVLRQFQILELEEVRERDRIIQQFERRRRQAVMDAVKLAEVQGQASSQEELAVPALEAPADTVTVAYDCLPDDTEVDEAK